MALWHEATDEANLREQVTLVRKRPFAILIFGQFRPIRLDLVRVCVMVGSQRAEHFALLFSLSRSDFRCFFSLWMFLRAMLVVF